MTAVNLRDALAMAEAGASALAGLVVLGWEDAVAYVQAAEELGRPVILQAGPGCRKHTPLPVIGKMLRHLADQAKVPVVTHLDHGYSLDECLAGIDCGFTSLMFDGSALPLAENIRLTSALVERAHSADISVEGEVGVVGYSDGRASHGTDPAEAALFNRDSGADAIAISIGNVHLQEGPEARIDLDLLTRIEAVTDKPLVLHGGSGIPAAMRLHLARHHRIRKFNIGTELRMAFGQALRTTLSASPSYDRIAILSATIPDMKAAALTVISGLAPQD